MRSFRHLPGLIIHRYPSGVWIISLIGLLNSMAISLSLPFLALYLYEKRGVPMAVVGLIILLSGVCAIGAQLLAGIVTDKIGRRSLLKLSMPSSIFLYIVMSLLIIYSAPVVYIVVVYALVRSTLSMQRPAIQSIVADLAPKERLTETFGLMIIGGNLGFAAGPALGGYLAVSLTYGALFGLGALIIGLGFILVLVFLKESFGGSSERVQVSSIISAGRDRNLLVFTLICFTLLLVASQLSSTLSVYTVSHAGFSTAQYGTLLTLNGLMITVLQYPATRFLSRLPIVVSLVTGAIFYGIGYMAVAWVGGYGLALGAVALVTAGEICCTPTFMTVVGRLASRNWRGRYMAFFGIADTLGFAVGPLIGGLLLDAFPDRPLLIWGTLGMIAFGAAIGFSFFGARFRSIQVENE